MIEARKHKSAINANNRFESKLSWKRIEALKLANSIKEFVDDNFNYKLPNSKQLFERNANLRDDLGEFYEEYKLLINFYYTILRSGNSIGHIVEGKDGNFKTQTLAHMYSKHRLEPVWNWRKSSLIRNVYYKYIKSAELWKHYHPVHIMLSLPHTGGKYKGKQFYAKELIEHFNIIRKYDFWKNAVHAGEYGVEIKDSPNSNGLHIHIHSFTLLKRKRTGDYVNKFREELKAAWKQLIEIPEKTQPIIWVETLYFYKKGENGRYITKQKDHKTKQKEISRILQNTKLTEVQRDEKLKNIKNTEREKFYIPTEIKRIKKLKLTDEEKEKQIISCYTSGVLECIKYHFKMDTFILDEWGGYDIGMLQEILVNTHRKRLYSRFGAFYNEKALSLSDNDLGKEEPSQETDEAETDEAQAKVNENLIDPYTGESMPQEFAQFVIFKPENRTYLSPKATVNSFQEINFDLSKFFKIEQKDIREITKALIQGKYDLLLDEFRDKQGKHERDLKRIFKPLD